MFGGGGGRVATELEWVARPWHARVIAGAASRVSEAADLGVLEVHAQLLCVGAHLVAVHRQHRLDVRRPRAAIPRVLRANFPCTKGFKNRRASASCRGNQTRGLPPRTQRRATPPPLLEAGAGGCGREPPAPRVCRHT